MSKKTIGLVVLLLIIIGGAIGYRMWNKPHEKVEDQEGIKITATALCDAYSADEAAANKQYNGKALEVSGTVSETAQTQDGGNIIRLQGNDAGMTVQCTMRDKGTTAKAGASVTVKGFCSGNTMFDVVMTDCVIK